MTDPSFRDLPFSNISFRDLDLIKPLLANVEREGYQSAMPIQAQAIPPILAGRDVLGSAPTGTGKTAAFVLPMLQRLAANKPTGNRPIRSLVLCPTRELATQIADSLAVYGRGLGLRHVVIFGGTGQQKQVRALREGVDIVIATPGRLMDLMGQRHVRLDRVEQLVLDEADRMLDMGFIPAVRKIAAHIPEKRQTLLFSATVPPTIKKLVAELMDSPERLDVQPQGNARANIDESICFVRKADKPDLLAHVVKRYDVNCGIVFSRTKHGADRVVKQLGQRGIKAVAIHGNRNQNQRQRALDGFKRGDVPILVATDVAARGIDVDGITHVINYDLTHEPETYVHRIGRTGRAGATGVAISFCDAEERAHLKAIQKLLRKVIEVDIDHPYPDGKQSVPRQTPPTPTKPKSRRGPKGKPAGKSPRTATAPTDRDSTSQPNAGGRAKPGKHRKGNAFTKPTKNTPRPRSKSTRG